jgi:adenosine/AMP kinase
MELKTVKINVLPECNLILAQSHFIKTVEDVYDALASSSVGIKFGLAFCEASGKCLVRYDGNDPDLKKKAAKDALLLSCGHSLIIHIKNAYPINVLTQLKTVPEVCSIFAATSNSLEVIIVETEEGRGILGVIDGNKSEGIEDDEEISWRKDFLRRIGYKT